VPIKAMAASRCSVFISRYVIQCSREKGVARFRRAKSITSNQEIFMPDSRTSLPVLFALGFRPLFLAGSLFAVLAVPLWIAAFFGHVDLSPAGGWLAWHRHEMVFGFGVAIVAGFLLTA